MVLTKSVTTPIDCERDGLRILAARFRGRGLPTSAYDVWMPSLGPSEDLLRKVLGGKMTWSQFLREYRRELVMDGPIDAKSKTIKNHGQKFTLRLLHALAQRGNVTVMCHCAEDATQCHRFELKRILDRS